MNVEKKYNFIYDKICELLSQMTQEAGLKESLLLKYYSAENRFDIHSDDTTLKAINERLVYSIQNRNMMPSVIKYSTRRNLMAKAWFDFDPKKIVEAEYQSENDLYQSLCGICDLPVSPSRLWIVFCKGVLSSSRFFSRFYDENHIRVVFDDFQRNEWTKVALPTLLAKEIDGIQFALACDFLKEIGYDYPKPDVHIMDFVGCLSPNENITDLFAFKEIFKISEILSKGRKISAYQLDKMIWLICSGNFYLDGKIVPSRKKSLCNYLQNL